MIKKIVTTCPDESQRVPAVAAARAAVEELCARLGLGVVREALPGADLVARLRSGLSWPGPGVLLRAADGWVHPGPPISWREFTRMARAMGAGPPSASSSPDRRLPDVTGLSAEAVDAMAGLWRLPAVAVRAPAPVVGGVAPDVPDPASVRGARVVTMGMTWATPLTGLALARLGVDVTRIEHPRRPDPFPLRDALADGQRRVGLDLDDPRDRERMLQLLEESDLLIDGNTPRVLRNFGLAPEVLAREFPKLRQLALTAFSDDDRPGYGLAAECRGGWAARTDPPRLGRTSTVDPIAGLIAAVTAVNLLATTPVAPVRLGLDTGVAYLFDVVHRHRSKEGGRFSEGGRL